MTGSVRIFVTGGITAFGTRFRGIWFPAKNDANYPLNLHRLMTLRKDWLAVSGDGSRGNKVAGGGYRAGWRCGENISVKCGWRM